MTVLMISHLLFLETQLFSLSPKLLEGEIQNSTAALRKKGSLMDKKQQLPKLFIFQPVK